MRFQSCYLLRVSQNQDKLLESLLKGSFALFCIFLYLFVQCKTNFDTSTNLAHLWRWQSPEHPPTGCHADHALNLGAPKGQVGQVGQVQVLRVTWSRGAMQSFSSFIFIRIRPHFYMIMAYALYIYYIVRYSNPWCSHGRCRCRTIET